MHTLLLAFRNIARNRRRSLVTVAAVAAGLIALNLFGGYIVNTYAGLKLQAISGERLGHLTIYKRGMLQEGKLHPKRYMFDAAESERLSEVVRSSGGVQLVSPRLSISGIAAASNGRASSIFIGEAMRPEDMAVLRGELQKGAGGDLEPGKNYGLAVSTDLAQLLNYKLGDSITLLSSTIDGQANALDGQIVNLFNTGNAATNDKFLLLPLTFAQNLLDTQRVERFVVLLDDAALTDSKRAELGTSLQAAGFDVEIKTWQELSSFYRQVRGLFDMIFSFIASIVFIIAALSIANTISMTVVERTREVGTLRALGLGKPGVVGLFASEAGWLAAIGTLAGLAGTVAFAWIINGADLSYVPPNSSYRVPLMVDLDWVRITVVSLVVVFLALGSAVLPSLRAARRGIVDALAHT
jgi:putative ABC transport system permease protein